MSHFYNFQKKTIFNLIFIVLVLSLFITNLFKLPYFGTKFQFTEIIILISLPLLPIKEILILQIKKNKTLFFLIILLIFFQIISSIYSKSLISIISTLGRLYLLFLFSFFYYYIETFIITQMNHYVFLNKIFKNLILFILLIAIIGFLLIQFNFKSIIFSYFENYPYFGSINRLQGFNTHPNMLANLLIFIILFIYGSYTLYDSRFKLLNLLLIFSAFICVFLTFSKSVIILLMGLILISIGYNSRLKRLFFPIIIFIFLIIYLFITHIIVAPNSTNIRESLKNTNFTSNKILYSNQNNSFIETGYLCLKRIELDVIKRNTLLGVGTGKFSTKLDYYRKINIYPEKLPNFDPHCTYLGLFAENGILSFFVFICVLIYILRLFIRNKSLLKSKYIFTLFVIFIAFLVEGISTDILNYRHLWFFLALSIVSLNNLDDNKVI